MTVKKKQTPHGAERPRQEELVIASDFGELERVRKFVRRFCRREGAGSPGEDRICDIELVATEVLTNIMRHAYGGEDDRDIHIKLHLEEDDALVLTVYDWGRPFDPDRVPPPDLDGSRTGGFGLYIIGQLVDELEFSRDPEGCNRTRLKMNLRGQNNSE